MTTVTTASTKEASAIHYLEDLVYDHVFSAVEPISTSRVVELLGGARAFNQATVKQLLSKSRRLMYLDRKWHLVARHRLRRRPTEGILRAILESYGKPLSMDRIAREFSILHARPEEYFQKMLQEVIPSLSEEYIFVAKDMVALREWFLELPEDPDTPYDAVLSLEDTAQMDTLHEKWESPLREKKESLAAYVGRLNSALDGPVSNTLVGYLLWKEQPRRFHPATAFAELLQTPGVLLLSGCWWCGEKLVDELRLTLAGLFEAVRKLARKGERALSIAAIMSKDDGKRMPISDAESAQINSALASNPEGMSLEDLVNSVFEVAPGEDDFRPLAFTALEALQNTPGIQPVGEYRWVISRNIPDEILAVPEVVEIEEVAVESAEGEEIDVELSDEGLEGDCVAFVHDPRFEDFGDSDEKDKPPRGAENRQEWTLPYHHYQAGTLYMRSIDRRMFPSTPRIYTTKALYLDDREYTLWLNNDLGLVFGLKNFYHEYCIPSGAVFHLKKGEREGEMTLEYDGNSDPVMTVHDHRLSELLALRQRAREARFSVFDILQEIMSRHAAGVRIEALFTELNVVRRTRRRMLASVLSAYHCFHSKKRKEEFWLFDPRKVSQGIKKVKRKYLVR